jgi:hypothetical protein
MYFTLLMRPPGPLTALEHAERAKARMARHPKQKREVRGAVVMKS